jgi:hypothetical protein
VTTSLYIAHQTATRTRLRLHGYRETPADVPAAIATLIATLSGVDAAEPRPATGSIVIHHPELSVDELNEALHALPLDWDEQVAEPPVQPALMPLTGGLAGADEWLHENSGGRVDVHTLIIVVMLSLALSQAVRGNIMAPAASLLWYALDLLLRRGGQPSS